MAETTEVDPSRIPRHVAIIMDGNGRWANERNLPRIMGHKTGAASVKDVVRAAGEIGIAALTLYAFSTENWKRPALEVQGLMALLKSYLKSERAEMRKNNIRLWAIGETEKLPADVRKVLQGVIAETAGNSGLVLNLALNYGSRAEIVRAARELAEKCRQGKLSPDEISEDLFAAHLFTCGLPDPDLVIRTGGESRLSNFLLWQSSYSEIYVTETYWPDFREAALLEAVRFYQARERRFGMTGEQLRKNRG